MGLLNYWLVVLLMLGGLYIVIAHGNLIKKMVGLNIFQTSVFVLFISLGKVPGGTAPIAIKGATDAVYSNPLPHVLILTAIVVGVATTAVGLALAIRIREAYDSVEEDEILAWREPDDTGAADRHQRKSVANNTAAPEANH